MNIEWQTNGPAVAMRGDSESMYAALQAYDSLLELREMVEGEE